MLTLKGFYCNSAFHRIVSLHFQLETNAICMMEKNLSDVITALPVNEEEKKIYPSLVKNPSSICLHLSPPTSTHHHTVINFENKGHKKLIM